MPYNLRYFLNYKDNASGLPVAVNIYFPDFGGVALELINADVPCIVSELNSNENLFAAIRAKEFRIKFVTDNDVYPGINEFATNNDSDWKVDIVVNDAIWLTGFLLTDQMSEGWYTDNTNHYIELVATDNLGTLKKLPIKDAEGNNFIPTIKQFLIDIVRPALNQAISGLNLNIFDNLFEKEFKDRNDTTVTPFTTSFSASASDRKIVFLIPSKNFHVGDTFTIAGSISNDGTYTVTDTGTNVVFSNITVAEPLVDESNTQDVTITITHDTKEIDSYQQAMVDMRTFTVNYDSYEDSYTVLTKILESRNSVLFQHMGEWYIVRISELFRVDQIDGSKYYANGRIEAISNASWTAEVNQDGDVIPVEQFMIKSFLNPVLSNKVVYRYNGFDELFCNELWKRGDVVIDAPPIKEYTVECWSHIEGGVESTTPATTNFRRRDIVNPVGIVDESYIFLETENPLVSFARSEPIQVKVDDKVSVKVSRRLKNNYTFGNREIIMGLFLYGYDGSKWSADDDGVWFNNFGRNISQSFSSGTDRNKWIDISADPDYIPVTGDLYLHLYDGAADNLSGQETQFKDLKVTYTAFLEGKTFVNIEGDYDKLTLPTNLKDTAEYEVYLSDSPKYLFKGALFRSDGITLTELWYEMQYPTTFYPIKRFNAIDHYRMSNRNMLKAEGNFYKWIKGDPLNSIQRVTFVTGDQNKRFLPAYIRDLDTSKSRFGALFIEIFDESLENPTTGFSFFVECQFAAPDTISFYYNSFYPLSDYFNIGDTLDILDTVNATTGAIVDTVDQVGTTATVTFTNVTFVDTPPLTIANFVNTSRGTPGNVVNAEHEFKYIFKAK